MTETKTTQTTVKYGGATLGVGVGNAIAYFGLQYAQHKHGIKFDDPVVAMAMAGALVSAGLLELKMTMRLMGRGFVYVFDRVFPAKKGDQDGS